MNKEDRVRLSKKMSFILRHGTNKLHISIQSDGFILMDDLLIKGLHQQYSLDNILEVVKLCEKKRYEIKTTNNILYIRASQGHTITTINVLTD